jgi:hypothetical protein
MSFKEKVQKIVLEMAEGQNLKEIKNDLLESVAREVKENHEKLVMASLDEWKQGTIKAAVLEVIKELTPAERKNLLSK